MAFSNSNLGFMNFGDGSYLAYRYGTYDDLKTVMMPGYFNNSDFGVNTILFIEASDGRAILKITSSNPKTVSTWSIAGCKSGSNVTSTTAGSSITFDSPFRSAPSVTVTPRNGESGDYFRITSSDEYGFTVTFYDNTGAAVSRTFDWTATNGGFAV